MTGQRTKLEYARILVDVKSKENIPQEIPLRGPNGTQIFQKVIYDWKTKKCSGCGFLGHEVDQCRRRNQAKKGQTGDTSGNTVGVLKPMSDALKSIIGGSAQGEKPNVPAQNNSAVQNSTTTQQSPNTPTGQDLPSSSMPKSKAVAPTGNASSSTKKVSGSGQREQVIGNQAKKKDNNNIPSPDVASASKTQEHTKSAGKSKVGANQSRGKPPPPILNGQLTFLEYQRA